MKVVLLRAADLATAMSGGGTFRYEPVSHHYVNNTLLAAEVVRSTVDAEAIRTQFGWSTDRFKLIAPEDAALQQGDVGLVLDTNGFKVLELV